MTLNDTTEIKRIPRANKGSTGARD
jgi:hypothetical protein